MACPLSRGARSEMTIVPANRSPSRLPCGEISEEISAGAPENIQNSGTPASPRNSACRNRSGPPSSLTTRSPSASLPRLRPLVLVSQITG